MTNQELKIKQEMEEWLSKYGCQCWEFQLLQDAAWEEVGSVDTTNILSLVTVAHLLNSLQMKAMKGGFDVSPLPDIIAFLINIKLV